MSLATISLAHVKERNASPCPTQLPACLGSLSLSSHMTWDEDDFALLKPFSWVSIYKKTKPQTNNPNQNLSQLLVYFKVLDLLIASVFVFLLWDVSASKYGSIYFSLFIFLFVPL